MGEVTWRARAAGLLGLLGVLGGLGHVLQGQAWWWRVAVVMVGVQLVVELVARRRPRLSGLAGVVAAVLLVTWVFVPGATVLGIPTPRTLAAWREQLSLAVAVIAQEQAPLVPPSALVAVMALGFGLLVVVVNRCLRSRRLRLLGPGLIAVIGLTSASLIIGVNPPAAAFIVTTAAWLALVAEDRGALHARPAALAAAIGAIAVLGGLLAPSVVAADLRPAATTWGRAPVDVFGRGINPMVRLGENLRRGESVEVMRSVTSAEEPPYLKVATLIDIDGKTWRPADDAGGLPMEDPLADIDPEIDVTTQEISVAVEGLDSTMLPVPYPAQDVRGLVGSWLWHPVGGTVRSRDDTTRRQTYVATYVEREPNAQQLRERPATLPARLMERYLALPEDTPPAITAIAQERTAGLRSDYDRIVALQDWMRDSFAYSEDAPVAEGYDGNGVEVIERFLVEEQSGYCVHFSSALAVMARTLGMPARIAVGYAPGSPAGRTAAGDRLYSHRSDSLHAWTEVYFSGVGWLSFDATPGVGRPTSYREPRSGGDPGTGAFPDAGVSGGTAAQRPQVPAPGQINAASAETDGEDGPLRGWLLTLGAAVAAAAVVLPGFVRIARRRRRWRAGRRRAEPLWREVVDTARDLGLAPPPTGTVRGQAAVLGAWTGPELRTVRDAVERERYAPGRETTAPVAAARIAVKELESAVPWWRRWGARVLPRSVVGRGDG